VPEKLENCIHFDRTEKEKVWKKESKQKEVTLATFQLRSQREAFTTVQKTFASVVSLFW